MMNGSFGPYNPTLFMKPLGGQLSVPPRATLSRPSPEPPPAKKHRVTATHVNTDPPAAAATEVVATAAVATAPPVGRSKYFDPVRDKEFCADSDACATARQQFLRMYDPASGAPLPQMLNQKDAKQALKEVRKEQNSDDSRGIPRGLHPGTWSAQVQCSGPAQGGCVHGKHGVPIRGVARGQRVEQMHEGQDRYVQVHPGEKRNARTPFLCQRCFESYPPRADTQTPLRRRPIPEGGFKWCIPVKNPPLFHSFTYDGGAPCLFAGFWSLVTCQADIREQARQGDVIAARMCPKLARQQGCEPFSLVFTAHVSVKMRRSVYIERYPQRPDAEPTEGAENEHVLILGNLHRYEKNVTAPDLFLEQHKQSPEAVEAQWLEPKVTKALRRLREPQPRLVEW
eukprot:COSAG01_NODE_7608_length_3129_cov_1.233333_2_plen_397_part_00